jgi:hypothetical protein
VSGLLRTYPDAEAQAKEDLADGLADEIEDDICTVGISLPTNWTKQSVPRIRVALDATPRDFHPVAQQPTIRVTVWAGNVTTAKELAQLAHAHLLARGGYSRLVGIFPAHDPDHDAELASFTVRKTVRSTPIT